MSDTGEFDGIPFGSAVVAVNPGGRECEGTLTGVEVIGTVMFGLVAWSDTAFNPPRKHVGRFSSVRLVPVDADTVES